MTARIETAECMGQELTFIRTETGEILYKQKRNLLPATYSRLLINALKKVGFSNSDWAAIAKEINSAPGDFYWNRSFYKPVPDVVRYFVEALS